MRLRDRVLDVPNANEGRPTHEPVGYIGPTRQRRAVDDDGVVWERLGRSVHLARVFLRTSGMEVYYDLRVAMEPKPEARPVRGRVVAGPRGVARISRHSSAFAPSLIHI